MEKLYTAMLPWADEEVRTRRRYLTDPDEIRAYRKKHLAILRQEFRLGMKNLPSTMLKLYHRFIVEFTVTTVALSIWLAAFGLGGWSLTMILRLLGCE